MRKLLIIAVGLLLLALPALVCSGGASGGGAGNTVANTACPDGWDAVRLGGVYHGVHFEVAGGGCECAEGSGFCASFEGHLHATNVVEAAWNNCGSDAFSIPGHTFSICTLEGWVSWKWDGQSNYVCVEFEPYE